MINSITDNKCKHAENEAAIIDAKKEIAYFFIRDYAIMTTTRVLRRCVDNTTYVALPKA